MIKMLTALLLAGLCGCAGLSDTRENKAADLTTDHARNRLSQISGTKVEAPPNDGITIRETSYAGVRRVTKKEQTEAGKDWVTKKQVSIDIRRPTAADVMVKLLQAQDISISAAMPLNGYTYSGGSLNNVGLEKALRSIFGSMLLDVEFDYLNKTALVRPLAARTWKLPITNRKSTYTAGATGGSSSASGSTPGGSGSSTSSSSSGGSGAPSGLGISLDSQAGSATASVTATEDLWGAIEKELKARLTVMVPVREQQDTAAVAAVALPPVAGVPTGGGSPTVVTPPVAAANPARSTTNLFQQQQIGFSGVNPEAGTAWVQAPHWVIAELDDYFESMTRRLNTRIALRGHLVIVNTDDDTSAGLDIQKFATFANESFGAVFSNNILGGITVGFPSGSNIPSTFVGGGLPGNVATGILSKVNGLQVFNAYLSKFGDTRVIERPVLSTTSGVPTVFSRETQQFVNIPSQSTTSSSAGGALAATQNNLVTLTFGTRITINPVYDAEADRVRAQLTLSHVLQSGSQDTPVYLTSGNQVSQRNIALPIPSGFRYSGEVLLKDGDLIIVGGYTEDSLQDTSSGLPHLKDLPVGGGLFGVQRKSRKVSTYYFALEVSVRKDN